jgi:hypothetical protein
METIKTDITDIAALEAKVRGLAETNVTSIRGIMLHFQALVSARAHRLMMEAPGLYYPDIPLYVISKGGMSRGHASMHKSIVPLLPEDKNTPYAFVLYPESFVRSCLDRLLRKTTKNITSDLRISMENVFNRKYYNFDFVDSAIEKKLIGLLQKDLKNKT